MDPTEESNESVTHVFNATVINGKFIITFSPYFVKIFLCLSEIGNGEVYVVSGYCQFVLPLGRIFIHFLVNGNIVVQTQVSPVTKMRDVRPTCE